MEELLDAVTGGALWGAGFALALGAVRAVGRGMRPVAKTVIKGGVAATDWVQTVTAESREGLQDLYHEARAELTTEKAHSAS